MNLFDWLHFSHPNFLLFIPLVLFLYLVKRHNNARTTQLSQFIDAKLLHHLQTSSGGRALPSWVGVCATCIFIVGIAGISWEKKPTQTFVSPQQSILILDQSLSMYATDIAPNRLTRLKQKVRDVLTHIKEGDIAITAYAGDAYVISPFSQDKSTLTHFLLALDPMIMPLYGNNLVAAFETALGLIKNPTQQTHLILFTDDVVTSDIAKIKRLIADYNVTISIVGVGTKEGATIALPTGQLLQSQQGVIKVKLPEQKLNELANTLKAKYYDSRLSDQDISNMLDINVQSQTYDKAQNDALLWVEKGHWFAFPFLFWLLYQFRAGVLLSLFLIVGLPFAQNSHASPLDWFTTPDQQAQKQVDQGNWSAAKSLFKNKEWQAATDYALEDYAEAAAKLEELTTPANSAEFFYNKGNSLALSGNLEAAIIAYEKALKRKKDFNEAQENLTYIKDVLAKQQEQNQTQQEDSQSSDSKVGEPNNNEGSNQQEKNSKQEDTEQANNNQEQVDQANEQQANEPSPPELSQETELDQEDKIALVV